MSVNYNPAGSTPIATDVVGGVEYPISKLATGAAGAAALVGDSNGLPVKIVGDDVGSAVETTDNTAIVTKNSKFITNGVIALTPKWAVIAASASGHNQIVAAVASKKIRVISGFLMANGTVNAGFKSASGGTDKTGLMYLIANIGLVMPLNELGWFETISGELLSLNLSAAIAVGGVLQYVEV